MPSSIGFQHPYLQGSLSCIPSPLSPFFPEALGSPMLLGSPPPSSPFFKYFSQRCVIWNIIGPLSTSVHVCFLPSGLRYLPSNKALHLSHQLTRLLPLSCRSINQLSIKKQHRSNSQEKDCPPFERGKRVSRRKMAQRPRTATVD